MPRTPPSSTPRTAARGTTDDVETLLASLSHPHAAEIHTLRMIIRNADPRIHESVKWNAPSFAITEHFATFHLRAKKGVQVVLHLGAKPRPDTDARTSIPDPAGLLEWRARDRATVTFADAADVEAKRAPFTTILRHWIQLV